MIGAYFGWGGDEKEAAAHVEGVDGKNLHRIVKTTEDQLVTGATVRNSLSVIDLKPFMSGSGTSSSSMPSLGGKPRCRPTIH